MQTSRPNFSSHSQHLPFSGLASRKLVSSKFNANFLVPLEAVRCFSDENHQTPSSASLGHVSRRTSARSASFTRSLLAALALLMVMGHFAALFAQEAPTDVDPEADPSGDPLSDEAIKQSALTDAPKVRHGIGVRLRYIFLPKSLIEVFMENAASGVSQAGFGLDYVRRKGDFELSVGFEYDSLSPQDGYYVERGGDPRQPGKTDLVTFKNLSWFTIDASVVYHHKLSSLVSLRYGGGLGFGLVRGDIIMSDAICTGTDLQGGDCGVIGPQLDEKQDFFRYPPVFNLLGGLQFTPGDNLAINVEVGMRTVFYSGVSAQYFF